MKTLRITSLTTAIALLSTLPAFAVDTTRTYSSGLLIGVFVGFCALLVVVQLAPSLMLLYGFLKGLLHRPETGHHAAGSKA